VELLCLRGTLETIKGQMRADPMGGAGRACGAFLVTLTDYDRLANDLFPASILSIQEVPR